MAPPGVAQEPLPRRCLTLFTGFDGIDGEDEAGILRRAMAQVGALGTGRAEAGYLRLGEGLVRCPYDGQRATEALDTQVREPAGRDGPVRFPRQPGAGPSGCASGTARAGRTGQADRMRRTGSTAHWW
ncbi:hypothetical protein ACFQ10_41835 [Streptomyces indonesiensis]